MRYKTETTELELCDAVSGKWINTYELRNGFPKGLNGWFEKYTGKSVHISDILSSDNMLDKVSHTFNINKEVRYYSNEELEEKWLWEVRSEYARDDDEVNWDSYYEWRDENYVIDPKHPKFYIHIEDVKGVGNGTNQK